MRDHRCRAYEHIVGRRQDCILCDHVIVDGVAIPWDECSIECHDAWDDERAKQRSEEAIRR
jgi:predicted nucleic acid-binding Zn ribbon protein